MQRRATTTNAIHGLGRSGVGRVARVAAFPPPRGRGPGSAVASIETFPPASYRKAVAEAEVQVKIEA